MGSGRRSVWPDHRGHSGSKIPSGLPGRPPCRRCRGCGRTVPAGARTSPSRYGGSGAGPAVGHLGRVPARLESDRDGAIRLRNNLTREGMHRVGAVVEVAADKHRTRRPRMEVHREAWAFPVWGSSDGSGCLFVYDQPEAHHAPEPGRMGPGLRHGATPCRTDLAVAWAAQSRLGRPSWKRRREGSTCHRLS